MRVSVRFVLAGLLTIAAAGCGGAGSYSSSTSPTPTPSGPTSITIVSGASGLTSTAFNPNPIVVPVGSSVTWTNGDNTAHTSTANDGSWNSGNIAAGQSYTRTFSTAGSFAYHCGIHPNRVGTVTVQ